MWVASAPGGPLGVALDAAGSALVLSLPAAARVGAAAGDIVAARGYFANWPLVSLYGRNGIPMEPWLLNATGRANPCAAPSAGSAWDASVHA